jgi:hypothetical protein
MTMASPLSQRSFSDQASTQTLGVITFQGRELPKLVNTECGDPVDILTTGYDKDVILRRK